jgi:transposase
MTMEVLHSRSAGLDVHKDSVVACVRIASEGAVHQSVETFGTTTKELLAMSDWLSQHGVTHVAMEATGVYWKPVWHVLEDSFELVLANAMHIKNVPGRKTDVNDATWIADLLAHGLIRGSFVPPSSIQDLRTLTRTRKQLVREKAQHVQRIQKTLEDANLKIASVVTDIMGMSGRAILDALVAGETDPEKLVALPHGRLKASRTALVEALRGRFTPHHRFMVNLHLEQIDALDRSIESVEREVGSTLEPFRDLAELLTTMPGVSTVVANVILSEIGIDMSRFPTSGHLISWAGLCPQSDESAGKRRSTRVRKGAPWLKTTLVQAAWGASRAKGTYLRTQFHRLKSRRGPRKAILAVAASMLTAAYFMLRDGVQYRDLGPDHFNRTDKSKTIKRLIRKLAELGCEVELKSAA